MHTIRDYSEIIVVPQSLVVLDIDDTIIAEPVLGPGDCSMTFRGGHNYVILEDDTIVFEYKTGPYLGVQFDKTFI